MNLFELLTVGCVLAMGFLVGAYLGSELGIAGWFAGFLVGAFVGILGYVLLRRLILGKRPR